MGTTEILLMEPVFKKRIWGGNAIYLFFGLPLSDEKIGEAWVISAHPNGPSRIKGKEWEGITLDQLYQSRRDLFGNDPSPVFPLLTKVLDARDRLSVQVHPNDEMAKKTENALGKSECWYILDALPNGQLVIGHHAKNQLELTTMTQKNQWDQLLRTVSVRKGDFIDIPAGTVHAIGAGIQILETQQSSDITYRLYDYDRMDETTGKQRELHLEKGLVATTVPAILPPLLHFDDREGRFMMVQNDHFTVEKWTIFQSLTLPNENHHYYLCTLISGNATINGVSVKTGNSFIITSLTKEITILGNTQIIVSYPHIEVHS
ncbi:MAG: type I phosphomannose isomerase catalytic subunit [Bacteroidales bacterium]